ncbi:MAG: phosphotransferase [Oscillospiraceae bacterium]|nr:phosphotransferase [Oscillospiraceae bacterium]
MNEMHAIKKIFGKTPVKLHCEPLAEHHGITGRIAYSRAGILRYHAVFSDDSEISFIGKRKTSRIVFKGMCMLSTGDPMLFLMLARSHKIFGYNRSVLRESRIYRAAESLFLAPNVFGSAASFFAGESLVAMEELPEGEPDKQVLYPALAAAAGFHAKYYGDAESAAKLLLNRYTAADYRRTRGCLRRLFDKLAKESECFTQEQLDCLHRFIDSIHTEFAAVSHRRTLTHNDYCVRNFCMQEKGLTVYDWELACFQNPEHDVVELLISVMESMSDAEILNALDYYRDTLASLSGITLSDAEYEAALRFNTLEYIVNKLSLLRHACRSLGRSDMELLAAQAARMMELLEIH